MKQDLFDWLNSQRNSQGEGLLVAPLNEIGDSESLQQERSEQAETFNDNDNAPGDSESHQHEQAEYNVTQSAGEYTANDSEYSGISSHEWQERATGFTLSLDEPPPELWMRINDDDPDPEYEQDDVQYVQSDSLQGAAYVQIHGRNFTQRLHHTLRTRKQRQMQGGDNKPNRANKNGEYDPSERMRDMCMILCSVLIMAIGISCIALYFVWRKVPPENFARIRNTELLIKAGQTVKVQAKTQENHESKTQSKDIPQPQKITRRIIPKEKPKTFTDYLNDGNYAYNIGMYNRAVINFWRAMNINRRDIRPYLGLSACYRKKGMYVDSYHIIEEARRIFGRSPAVDMAVYFLREAQRK